MADNNEGNVRQEGQSANASWTLRRAELDWWRHVQKATSGHQERSAMALAEYHRTVAQIAEGSANEEKAAIEAASEYHQSGTTDERKREILREWNERITEIRRTAFGSIREAGSKLAEAQQQSWLDAAQQQNEAYATYVSDTADIYPASPFPIGDEGRGAPQSGWNWMDAYMGQAYTGFTGGRC